MGKAMTMTATQTGQPARQARVQRTTRETEISVAVDLDGGGTADVETGIGFFDHMLDQIARHGLIDLEIRAKGDLHIDMHHTVEDTGIVLGQALGQALGERRGITRYASIELPMDETLTRCALDLSGRPFLVFRVDFDRPKIGDFDTELVREFFQAVSQHAGATLHLETLYGANNHHIAESCFKAFARAFSQAVALDPRVADRIPSTKGVIEV